MYDLQAAGPHGMGAGLVHGVRRRDPEALGALFDLFASGVYAALSRVESDTVRLDQLVEDVFWEVWVTAGALDGEPEIHQRVVRAVALRLRPHPRQQGAGIHGDHRTPG